MYSSVAVIDHCVMVIMQLLYWAWPWFSKRLKYTLDFDLRTVESGWGELFALLLGVIDTVRRVGIHRTVLKTRYAPARALAVLLYVCVIDWTCLDVARWYPYDSTSGDVYAVSSRRKKQGKTCPGLVLYG